MNEFSNKISLPDLSHEELALLLELGERLVSELDLEKVLKLVAEAACQVVHAETLVVPMIDSGRQTFTYRAASGKYAEMLSGQTFPINEGACGWVMQHQRPLLFGEGSNYELATNARWQPGMASSLLVPLICRGTIAGGLSAMGKQKGSSFNQRDLTVLTLFGNQASIAIDNARLFHNLDAEEARLRASEQRYRSLFNSAEVAMFMSRLDGSELLDCNDKFLEIVGGIREELIGKPSVILWENPQKREEMVRQLKAEGRVTDLEFGMLNTNGELRCCVTSLRLFRENGQLEGSIRDITDFKRAEELLRESEDNYRFLFENMLEGYAHCKMLYEHDAPLDFIYLNVNRKFEEITGLTDVVGKKVSEVIPGLRESNPELFEVYGRVAKSGQPERLETYVDDLGIWFSLAVYSPRREHFVAVFDNITTRKQAEIELRMERDRNLMYLNTVQTLMVALNAEGSISMINRAGCELLGYKENELLGRNWFTTCLPQPEGMEVIYPMFRKIMGGKLSEDEYYENSVLCRDGTFRLIAWNNTYISDDAGHNIGTLSSGQDITTRKLAETALRESEDRFRIIFTNAIDGILLVNAETRKFVMANPSIAKMLGYDSEEILGIGVDDVHPVEALSDIAAGFEKRLASEITAVSDVPVKRKDGSVFYADINPVPVNVKGTAYMLATFRDITERKQSEDALRQAAAVFESSHDGAVITDIAGCILAVNHAYLEITGYSEAEMLGQNPRMLHSGRHNIDFYQSMWANVKEAGYWQGEIWNRRKNGEIYPERLTISAVKNASGNITHYVGMSSDLSQIKRSETQLEHLAHYDPLTDMPNRLLVQSHLTHTLAQSQRLSRQVGVLYLDLDRFKSVNESLGYPVGDELLVKLTKRLTSRLRSEDILARLGGDEFLLVMEDMESPEDIAGVARSLLELLAQPFVLSGEQEVFIGASIGISVFPNDGSNASQLIQNADSAMHQAKKQGRNTFSFYTDALTRAASEHFELETRLRHAIAANQLRVYYQPQIDIATGRIIGAEALVRWLDPKRGLIPPVHFIPLAEETGLINAIGEWVLRETWLSFPDAGGQSLTASVYAWQRCGTGVKSVGRNRIPRLSNGTGIDRKRPNGSGGSCRQNAASAPGTRHPSGD